MRKPDADFDITRRDALVTLGQAAAAFALPPILNASPQLPPGVYLPSSDHLGHALMSSERFRPIPPGCPTDYIRPGAEPFRPLFFSPADFAVLRRITQLLLGEEGEPSSVQEVVEWIDLQAASAAGVRKAARELDPLHHALAVAYFGSARVSRLETADPEKICRDGLKWFADAARSQGADQFLSLPEQRQIGILEAVSDARPGRSSENAGTRFFTFLKAEVIKGYYTSQAGLKELDFKGNAFYARSPGCDSRKIQKPIT